MENNTATTDLRNAVISALPSNLTAREDLIAALIDPASLPRTTALAIRAELSALPLAVRQAIQTAIKAVKATSEEAELVIVRAKRAEQERVESEERARFAAQPRQYTDAELDAM